MSRPKAAVPKSLLKAYIPLELRGKLDLLLVSDLEGRVPLGRYSELVEQALRQHLEWAQLDLSLYGFPAGYFVRGPLPMLALLRDRLELAQKADHGRLGG